MQVQLQSQGQVVSLGGRAADIAIRMVRPTSGALTIGKLPPQPIALLASRAWLAGRDPAGHRPDGGADRGP